MGKTQTLKTHSPEDSLKSILHFLVEKNLRYFNPTLADKNKQEFLAAFQELKTLVTDQQLLNFFEKQDINNVTTNELNFLKQALKTLKNLPKNYCSTSSTSEASALQTLKQVNFSDLNNLSLQRNETADYIKPQEFQLAPSNSSSQSNLIQSSTFTPFFSRPNSTTSTISAIMTSQFSLSMKSSSVLPSSSINEEETAITHFKEIDLSKIQVTLKNQEAITLSKNLGENFKLCIKKATDIRDESSRTQKNSPNTSNLLFQKNEVVTSIKDVLDNMNYRSTLNTHKIVETLIQEYQNGNFEQYTDKPDELFKAAVYFLLNAKNTDEKAIPELLETFDHQKPHVCSQEFKEAVESLMAFLKEDKDLCCPFFNREKIVAELLSIILFPSLMNQGDQPLCGVDVFLRELALKSPLRFVQLGLNLAKEGFSTIPFNTKFPFNLDEESIVIAMMCAIRNSYNLTGYHPRRLFKIGDTSFNDLYVWFRKSGFEIIEDTEKLGIYEEDSLFFKKLLIGEEFSCDKHVNLDQEKQVANIKNYIKDKNASIVAVISPDFAGLLSAISNSKEYSERNIPKREKSFAGHWVKILAFSENADQTLNLEINTWGGVFKLTNLAQEAFKEHFHGAFVAEFKNSLTLNELPEEIKTPSCTLL